VVFARSCHYRMLYRDERAVPSSIQRRGKSSVTPRYEDEDNNTMTFVGARKFPIYSLSESGFGSAGFARPTVSGLNI
jgi:hypothetical protein